MKNIVKRRVDELGRVVLPREARDKLEIQTRDMLGISVSGNTIVLEKCADIPQCVICGTSDKLTKFSHSSQDYCICAECKEEISNL